MPRGAYPVAGSRGYAARIARALACRVYPGYIALTGPAAHNPHLTELIRECHKCGLDSNIALSGAYDAGYFFDGYKDDPLIYNNSPVDYIEGMPYDHPYVEMYRNRDIIICCGRGAWEHPMQEDAARMAELFRYKDIPAWVDIWGNDVYHDWPWWRIELPYFISHIC
jgi:hypothetical protein